jgi:Molecular chaperone
VAVKPSYGLSDDEVERMIGESFQFAAQDFKARQLIEGRNEAEAILKATDKALSQGAHLLAKEELAVIQASLAALDNARLTDDHKAIRSRIQDVEKVTHHFAELLMDTSLKEALQNKKLSEMTEHSQGT